MKKQLCNCEAPEEKLAGSAKFIHWGISFDAFKRGGECAGCVQNRYTLLFDKYRTKLMNFSADKKLIIDWKYFIDIDEFRSEYNSREYVEICDLLQAINILSISSEGRFEIFEGINIGPNISLFPSYFSRKEDVLSYAKAKYSNTVYSWQIRSIGEVISKTKALEIS